MFTCWWWMLLAFVCISPFFFFFKIFLLDVEFLYWRYCLIVFWVTLFLICNLLSFFLCNRSFFFFWLLLRFFFVFVTDFKLFNYDMPWCSSFHLSCAWAFFSFLEFWIYSFFNHTWKTFAPISSEYFPVLPSLFFSSGISVTCTMYIQPL